MPNDARALRLTLIGIWIAVAAGAIVVLQQQPIPFAAALGAAVALWIEASLYAASGFDSARTWYGRVPHKSAWLAISVLPPYLAYSVGNGTFQWRVLLILAAAAIIVSFWFEWLPDSDWTDLGFLVLIAAGLLLRLFPQLYPPLSPKIKQSEFIGHLMWLRLAFWALLTIRKRGTAGFGFWPRPADWAVGARYFLYATPLFALLLWATRAIQWKERLSWGATPVILAGTFFGILWVVALSEDFLVQGILLPILTRWTRSAWWGLGATSVCFGLVHVSYRGFPNWRMVLLAGVLGAFCGRAVQVAGSIRAGMVMHALAVAVYRTLIAEK